MLSHSASELSAILSAFKSLHGSAAVAAPDGSILLADPEFARLAGSTPESLSRLPAWQAAAGDAAQRIRDFIACSGKTGATPARAAVFPFVVAGAPQRECTVSVLPGDGEEIAGFLVTLREVTGAQDGHGPETAMDHRANLLSLVNSTDDVVWSVDRDFKLTVFNEAFARGLEKAYGCHVRVGAKPEQLLPPDLAESWNARYAQALSEGPFRFEYDARDGRALDLNVKPIISGDKAVGVSVFGRLIGERRALQAELRKNQEANAAMLAAMAEGIVYQDADSRILACNARAQEILGLPAHRMAGLTSMDPIWKVVDEHGAPVSGESQPASVALRTGAPVSDAVMGVCQPDGTLRWIKVNSRLVTPGEPSSGVVTTFRDVTEERIQEGARAAAERHYHEIFDAALEGIYQSTPEGRFLLANPALARILGYASPEDLIASVTDVAQQVWLNVADRDALAAEVEARGSRDWYECQWKRKDGTPVWLQLRSRKVVGADGRTAYYEGFVADMTERKNAEAAQHAKENEIRVAEARYRKLNESIRDGFARTDLEGYVLECNEVLQQMLGYSSSELRTLSRADFIPEKWRARANAVMQEEVLLRGYSELFEMELLRKDGTCLPVELRVELAHDEHGQPSGTWATVRDIGARRQMEQALLESEEKFERIFRASPAATTITQIGDTVRIVDVNEAWERNTGYTRAEVVGRSYEELGLWAEPDELARARHLLYSGGCRNLEFHFRRKNGQIGTGLFSWELIELSGSQYSLSATVDITAEKEAQLAAQEAHRRYQEIFEGAPEGIYRSTVDGKTLAANPAMSRLLGYESPEEQVALVTDAGRQVWVDEAERAWFAAQLEEHGVVRHHETRFRRKDGSVLWASLSSRKVRDAVGGPQYVEGFVEDITDRKAAEAALLRREAELRDLVTHLRAGVIVCRPDASIVMANDEAVRLLELTPDQRYGTTPAGAAWSYVREDGSPMDMAECPFLSAVSGQQPVDDVILGIHKQTSGELVWLLMNSFPEFDDHRQLSRVVMTFVDVTARRTMEERYRSVMAQASDGIVVIKSGQCEAVNPALCEMSGWTAEELIGRPIDRIVAPQEQQRLAEFRQRLSEAPGKPVLMATKLVRPDGSLVDVEVHGRRISGGQSIGVVRDTTERNRAQAALEQSNVRLQLAVTAAGAGIWEWDMLTGEVVWDDRMLELYGLTREAFSRHNQIWREALHPDDRAMAEQVLQAATRGERNFDIEFRVVHPDGSVRHLKSDAFVLRDAAGHPIRVVGLNRDITSEEAAIRERERLHTMLSQSQTMESVGRLAGGVAHDFNNLLTVMNGYSRLMLQDLQPGDPWWRYLTEINEAGERAAALTKQLLTFGRQDATAPSPDDLNRLVRQNRTFLSRLIGEDIVLEVDCSPEECAIMANPVQLHRVLLNLAVNARDAMPGGGRLIFRTRRVNLDAASAARYPGATPGPYAVLSVTDTGIGMDKEVCQHLFEPFYTTKGPGKGTGLGLSTVYGIAQQHNAWIDVQSQPGHGTTFSIGFPLAVSPEPLTAAPPVAVDPALRGTETVLVVEDQDEVRQFTSEVLRSFGYRVVEAPNGAEAMAQAERLGASIDVVLSDVVMPGMGGRELASRLERILPGVPVILMTGYSGKGASGAAADEPRREYLEKPFTPQALSRRIRTELRNTQRPRARILVVDDEAAIRTLLSRILTDAGYEVAIAGDGKQAVNALAEEDFDLMLTDLVMPDQEGIETIQMLRNTHPELKIVAVSGAFGGAMLRAAELLGAHATLAKPVGAEELVTTIKSVLGK